MPTLQEDARANDTYVDEDFPTTQFSGAATINVFVGGASNAKWGFTDFDGLRDIIPTGSTVTSATLLFEIILAVTNGVMKVEPVEEDWPTSGIVWNTAQSLTFGAETATIAVGAKGLYSIIDGDLIASVQAIIDRRIFGFRWTKTGNLPASVDAVGGGNTAPNITVVYDLPPAGGVMTLGHDVGWPQTGMVLGERVSRKKKRRREER